MNLWRKIERGATWPFRKVSKEIGEDLAEKAAIAAASALAEMPILDDLLDGKPVEIVVTVQMKRREG